MSSLADGFRLLHFKILRKLGQGGMGEVYLAEDTKLGRKVGIKVLPPSAAGSEKARLRFLQEARSASALNHPNIVTIYSIEQFENVDFIVMEYVEGETLSSILNRGPLSFPKYLDFFKQIAQGLEAAHQSAVIHRDIKPSNLFVTTQGMLKILDFGLAKQLAIVSENSATRDDVLTEAGSILGTVYYMSPEQVRGEALDAQSDLFSFGCVLYEAATGRLPFRGGDPASVMYQIVHAPVVPPSTLRTDFPPELDAIVLRAMAKDKTLRYRTAQEIADHLLNLGFQRTQDFRSTTLDAYFPISEKETFVGREQELEKLQQSIVFALQKSGSTRFLVGEPGIGKTALADCFLQRVARSYPDLIIGRGRCIEHFGTGEAYLPFLDAIGGFLKGSTKERAVEVLRSYAPTWCSQFPAAFTSTTAHDVSQKEAAVASKERMLREISDALTELSNSYPLILFLEDLHWADASTADLLRYLSRRIQGHRILILGTMREEDLEAGNPPMKACRLDLQAQSLSEEIRLNSLSEIHVQQFLNTFYSPNLFPEQFTQMIFRKTEGHPLFVAGLLQFLVSEKVLERSSEMWTLKKPLSEMDLNVPENVRSMIKRKMEALNEEDRRILQFAAIEGAEFTSTVLSDLLNVDEIDLEEKLNRIERNYRFIVQSGEEEWPDHSLVTKYRFAHALYQNAFYADLISKRRIQLHRQAGESLLKHYGAQAPKIANKLGAHFRNGRDFEKAIQYLSLAGDQAKTMYANAEAEHLYGRTLEMIQNLLKEDQLKWNPVASDLHEKRADSLTLLGRQPEAKQEFESALAMKDPEDTLGRARLNRKIAKTEETQRNFQDASRFYSAAESLLSPDLENRPREWQREWLQIYLDRIWFYYTKNLQAEMEKDLLKIEPFIHSIATPTQKFMFYRNSVMSAYRRERYRFSAETIQLVDLSRKAAEETGSAANLADSHFVSGFSRLWSGDLKASKEFFQFALSQALRLEDVVLQSRCLTYITILHRRLEDVEEVKSWADKSLKLATAINMMEYVAAAKANLAWIAWREKDLEKTKLLANEAIQIWQSLPLVSPFQCLAAWPLIGALLQENQISQACQVAEIMLDPAQQKLGEELETLLRQAVQACPDDPESAKAKLIKATNTVEIGLL